MVLLAAVTPSGAQESVDVKVIVGAGCGTVLDVALHVQPAMGVAVGLGVAPAAATEGKLSSSSSITCLPVKFHDPAMCTVLAVAMHVQLACHWESSILVWLTPAKRQITKRSPGTVAHLVTEQVLLLH